MGYLLAVGITVGLLAGAWVYLSGVAGMIGFAGFLGWASYFMRHPARCPRPCFYGIVCGNYVLAGKIFLCGVYPRHIYRQCRVLCVGE